MLKSVIKYINISYFFLICININGNIMLDENDKLTTPLPLPYNGEIYNVESIDVMDSLGSSVRFDVVGLNIVRVLPSLDELVNEE